MLIQPLAFFFGLLGTLPQCLSALLVFNVFLNVSLAIDLVFGVFSWSLWGISQACMSPAWAPSICILLMCCHCWHTLLAWQGIAVLFLAAGPAVQYLLYLSFSFTVEYCVYFHYDQ